MTCKRLAQSAFRGRRAEDDAGCDREQHNHHRERTRPVPGPRFATPARCSACFGLA
jgi:hypothetical protein